MGTLDTIIQMQQSGMNNEEIIQNLQTQGVSPREINDAINQAQVKNAVTQAEPTQQPMMQVPSPDGINMQQPEQQQMQPDQYQQQPMTMQQPEQQQMQPDPYQNYYQETPQAYSGDESYQQPAYDTETITEIAEQVISEKFKEFNKKNGDIATFKNATQDKINDIDSRLKRIEGTIDKLQQAIIQKIGEFGENTASIRKEISGLHDTTSKLMNPLIDNYRELEKMNNKHRK